MIRTPRRSRFDGFCERYGIKRTLAYEEIAAGRLVAVKVGRRTLIRREGAERWLANAERVGRVG